MVLTVTALREVQGFLATHATISDGASLEAFKSLARRNMKFAIVLIVLWIPGLLVGLHLINLYSIPGLVVLVASNALLFILARKIKARELDARSLPCADEILSAEYARVSEMWTKKLFPNF